MIRCEDCGQRFGGDFVFQRHRSRRLDRCLNAEEMKRRGLKRDRRRIWHQPHPSGQTRLRGVARFGSTRLEDRRLAAVPDESALSPSEGTPQQRRVGSA